MDERRQLAKQVELAATPEEVWQAIATPEGMSIWFVPHEQAGERIEADFGGDNTQAGQVLGSPVTAEAVPLTAWREGPGAGLPEQEAQELAAMFAAYDETGFAADPAPLAALLGRRATTWAELLRRLSTNQRT